VPVKSDLGHAGFLDDPIDAGCPDAFRVKEPVRREKNPFPGRRLLH
jgi:hypothetical protein